MREGLSKATHKKECKRLFTLLLSCGFSLPSATPPSGMVDNGNWFAVGVRRHRAIEPVLYGTPGPTLLAFRLPPTLTAGQALPPRGHRSAGDRRDCARAMAARSPKSRASREESSKAAPGEGRISSHSGGCCIQVRTRTGVALQTSSSRTSMGT